MTPTLRRTLKVAAPAVAAVLVASGGAWTATAAPSDTAARPGTPPGLAQKDTLRFFTPDQLVIGTAVAGGGHHADQPYPDPFPNDRPYRELVGTEFSSLSPENQSKWEFIHPERDEYNFGPMDDIVAFAEENGQVVRGHTLLWHSQNPEWLEEGDFTDAELRQILKDHVDTVVGRYAGKIHQWDVVNEVVLDDGSGLRTEENVFVRELGPEVIADVFRWAHAADPEAELFFNDYGVESIGPKSDVYHELVQDLLADGVPVDGFSFQGHLSTRYGFPADVQANLQRFADLGLKTAITELDVRMDVTEGEQPTAEQLAQQSDYYTRMLDACLAVEGCNSFTLWGFTDKYSWVPVFFEGEGFATVMDEDFSRKPAYCDLQETLAVASGKNGHPAFGSRNC